MCRIRRVLRTVILLLGVATLPGCAFYRNAVEDSRLSHGLTLVLPGIDAPSVFNSSVAQGLEDGGVDTAIEVHDWTTGTILAWPVHLLHLDRNKQQARVLAQKIVKYQDRYPGRPVHLIGHSAGCAIIVFALEELPPEHSVTSAVLVAGALSPDYDLSPALSKTSDGIWNYSSPFDALFLGVATTALGTVDRAHRPSAGATGFNRPPGHSQKVHELYETRLHEVPYEISMLWDGNTGGHFGATNVTFAREQLAPVILGTRRD